MPIYEYKCSGCNHQFDAIQKMQDEPIKICPHCSEAKAVRLISAAGFQLKGSGWYATDFKGSAKSDSSTSTTSTETTTSKETSTPSTTGSDSK